MCAKLIAMRLAWDDAANPKTRICFLTFTHEVRIGCNWTNKFDEFAGTLAVCKQPSNGGTSAKAALTVRVLGACERLIACSPR